MRRKILDKSYLRPDFWGLRIDRGVMEFEINPAVKVLIARRAMAMMRAA